MTGYSKGSRGLFVYSPEASIFTAATVSPGLSRRQRPSRYAIRAGRNLPDKEFRSALLRSEGTGESFRFRSPLHVAMQLGPSHSPTVRLEIRRMASEDFARRDSTSDLSC